jgi:hypothetical protein
MDKYEANILRMGVWSSLWNYYLIFAFFCCVVTKINFLNPSFIEYKKQLGNPVKFRWFMLTSLPVAFFAGLKVEALEENQAIISIKQKWFNKNPFRSIYFAMLSMAAEVSTGILCMAAIYKRSPPVSMLVVKAESFFYKKAVGKILFTCEDGDAINNTVEEAIAGGEGKTIRCNSVGKNEKGETVAEFYFTWSFKGKTK